MHFSEDGIRHQTMIGKHNIPPQAFIERRPAICRLIIVRQRGFSAGLSMTFRKVLKAVEGVDSRLRGVKRFLIDICRVKDCAIFKPLFPKQNGK